MSFFDKIKDKLTPEPSGVPISTSASGGIGSRRGALGFEDDVCTFSPFEFSWVFRAEPKLNASVALFSNLRYVTMFIPLT